MYPSNNYSANLGTVQKQYYTNQVNNASPIQLVILAHDFIITACRQENSEKAIKGLKALADALDFNYPDISLGLYNIYQWCIKSVTENNYDEVIKTLTELRNSWQATQTSYSTAKQQPTNIHAAG